MRSRPCQRGELLHVLGPELVGEELGRRTAQRVLGMAAGEEQCLWVGRSEERCIDGIAGGSKTTAGVRRASTGSPSEQ